MKTYNFTLFGKIKQIIFILLLYGIIIAILVSISTFYKLYYFTWIPIIWILYRFLLKLVEFITNFSIDDEGLNMFFLLDKNAKIRWEDIEKIGIDKYKSKILSMYIYSKDKDRGALLTNGLKDFQELVNAILLKLKKEKTIVINYKNYNHSPFFDKVTTLLILLAILFAVLFMK